MPSHDLDEISRRVAAARRDFLTALDAYQTHDGRTIVTGFVKEFFANDRSELTKETAEEAAALIKGFDGSLVRITSQVAMALMQMESTVVSLQIGFLGKTIGAIAEPPTIPDGASPTERALAHARKFSSAAESTAKVGDAATRDAFRVGELIEELEDLSRDVIKSRTLTLSVFKQEHFGVAPGDLFKAVKKGNYLAAGNAALDLAMNKARDVAIELGQILLEENDIYRYGEILVRLKKALETKKPDTSPGGTELLNRLVSQMRSENRLIASLEDAYEKAMAEMDRISKAAK